MSRIERNLSISNWRPSRPTRTWRKKIGRPSEIQIATRRCGQHGQDEQERERRRRRAVDRVLDGELPAARVRRRAPRRAAGRRCARRSRGRSRARTGAGRRRRSTPSSSQRRTSRSSTSCGAVEKVTITCSTSCCDDHVVEVPARAEHRHRHRAVERVHRLLVQEPDRLEAQLRMRQQPLRQSRPDRPAPTISVGRIASPCAARLRLRPVQCDPAGHDVGGRERPRADRLRGQIDGLAEELAQRQNRHRRERGGSDDTAEVLEQLGPDPAARTTPEVRRRASRARRRRRG